MSCSLSGSLMECGVWRAVIRSVLHHPAGQNGRDDTGDLWIIYQRWRLSHRIKNVALAQMTFSHHHVLITQCHKDPPPLLPYLAAVMSGHAINYAPRNYARLGASHQVDPDLIWHEKIECSFPFIWHGVWERLIERRQGTNRWVIQQRNEVTWLLNKSRSKKFDSWHPDHDHLMSAN